MKSMIAWSSMVMTAAATVVACEGEPPMTPADLPSQPAASVETPAVETTSPTPPPVQEAAPSASATPAVTSAPPASSATASADAHARIVGKVKATPATMSRWSVVWLEDGPPDATPPKAVSIDNRKMSFVPFVAVAPVGAKVIFSDSDPFPHNVFSPDNERFNLGNIAQHSAVVRSFKQEATYSLLCNLHPDMLGYLVVTPSSRFAKASADGSFALGDLPAGTYKVTAWAPRNAALTQSITVKDGDATLDFDLHR